MLENGKMGHLERVFEVILEQGRFCGCCGRFFNVIYGPRPANLFSSYSIYGHCRTQSGNLDQRVKPVDDNKVVQCGRSMIEMLGVLAIVGVLSVGGIAGYSKAMTKFKTNQIVNQVATIVANVKALYAQQESYAGLDEESALSMGAIPEELLAASGYGIYGSYFTNPFNGSVSIYSSGSAATTGEDEAFIIAYYDLPREACISLATNGWGGDGFVFMFAGSGYYNNDNSIYDQLLFKNIGCSGVTGTSHSDGAMVITCDGSMSPSNAAFACNCEGNTCAVGWKYY